MVGRAWEVRQTLHDPEGNHDWVIDGVIDVDASDETGELVLADGRDAPAGWLTTFGTRGCVPRRLGWAPCLTS